MSEFTFAATCSFGLEAVLARELRALGLPQVAPDNGHVAFRGDFTAMARANMWARTADRIWLRLGQFPAATFEELFEGTRKLPWSDLMPSDAIFPVDGLSHASKLTSVPACQAIVKKAVVEAMKESYGLEWFPENGPTYPIRMSLAKDVATLSIDTSGTGLHKRGYRLLTTGAPLRETLAAGLVQLSYWNSQRLLVDPFCGSGTILLEAALLGLNCAPGWHREFCSEQWPIVGTEPFAAARQEAEQRFDRTTRLELRGYDRDDEAVKSARGNLAAAKLEGRGIAFETQPMERFHSRQTYGVLIANPPYGERLSDTRAVEDLYVRLGETVRPYMDTWSIYVLTAHPQFSRLFGVKEQRRRKLYNGLIECNYYQYPGPRPPELVEI